MFKGLAFILVLGLVIVLVIIAVIASFVYRAIHHVKKVINGEDDNYNPEIGKKHQHYTHKAYGRGNRQASQNDIQWEERVFDEKTGEELYRRRKTEQTDRQIFSADEGEYVDFVEEH